MNKFNTTIKTSRITSWFSSYWRNNSYSFTYRDTIEKTDISLNIFRDKSFDNLTNNLKSKDKVCFIYTKWFWWDILRNFQSRDWDTRIKTDTWFIVYNWKVYLWKINELNKSNNWNWSFWSATEWLKDYEIILEKEIILPKITVHIKDKYKTKEWEFTFNKDKKEYVNQMKILSI